RVVFPELEAFSLPVVLAGLVLLAWGPQVLTVLLVPLAFLYFMIPLPVFILAQLTQTLKLAAVSAGVALAGLVGTSATAEGSFVELESGVRLLVGDPCSGMRSLIALSALALLLAFEFSRLRGGARLILLVLALPLAFASNVVRITVLCVSASWMHGPVPGWLHDIAGGLVYALALVGLLAADRLLAIAWGKRKAWVGHATS
ncbi:MAG: exosortase/archaeosortase family protein, partial [Planctomycetota bacterium]